MTSKKFIARAHQRFQVKAGTFAVLFRDSSKLGHLIDISIDGFSFCFSDTPHLDGDRDGRALLYPQGFHLAQGFREFDLFGVGGGITLDRVPCNIVATVTLQEGGAACAAAMRRCCIRFEALAPERIRDLSDFIRQCTEAPI